MLINGMSQEELTAKSISAAFDSVDLINKLNAIEVLDDEQKETKSRNQEHLSIMIAKDDFKASLTQEQIDQINAVL